MTTPTTLRTELVRQFVFDYNMNISGGMEEDKAFEGLVASLEALYTRKLAEVEKAARIAEVVHTPFPMAMNLQGDYQNKRIAELQTGKEGEV